MSISLVWALKESFAAYVSGLPDGRIAVSGAAGRAADGAFAFPALDATNRRFGGTVRFTGYGGVLDLEVSDPILESEASVTFVTLAIGPSGERVRFARLGAPCPLDTVPWTATAVTATDDGAALLGGVYAPGAPLADVSLVENG